MTDIKENAEPFQLSGEPKPTLTDELKACSYHHENSDQAFRELAGILESHWPGSEFLLDDIA